MSDTTDETRARVMAMLGESQRMATLTFSAILSTKLVKAEVDEDLVLKLAGEALEETWAERGIDTPASGWNPG
jgi:hypothetical protein